MWCLVVSFPTVGEGGEEGKVLPFEVRWHDDPNAACSEESRRARWPEHAAVSHPKKTFFQKASRHRAGKMQARLWVPPLAGHRCCRLAAMVAPSAEHCGALCIRTTACDGKQLQQ
jgi:hypothetical protein